MKVLENSFNNMKILEKSMDASWLRNEAISNNIANVNTPKFKKNVVKFESILAESLSSNSIEGRLTHEKHLSVGAVNVDNIVPTVTKDYTTKYRKDGNNVNIDVEMASMAKNTMRFYALKEMVSSNLQKIKLAVRDGR